MIVEIVRPNITEEERQERIRRIELLAGYLVKDIKEKAHRTYEEEKLQSEVEKST